MKVLPDTCMSSGAKAALQAAGHDVIWAGDWAEDPGDSEILAMASDENRILITLDKDFGKLASLHGAAHCGILRLVNFRAKDQGPVCVSILERHGQDLCDGAIVTAEPGRLRMRLRSGFGQQ